VSFSKEMVENGFIRHANFVENALFYFLGYTPRQRNHQSFGALDLRAHFEGPYDVAIAEVVHGHGQGC
jgi:hypothetical protein